jgi:hypothetical protein
MCPGIARDGLQLGDRRLERPWEHLEVVHRGGVGVGAEVNAAGVADDGDASRRSSCSLTSSRLGAPSSERGSNTPAQPMCM